VKKLALLLTFCLGAAVGGLAAAGGLIGCAGAGGHMVENQYIAVDLQKRVALVMLTEVAKPGYKLTAEVGRGGAFVSVRAVERDR
jgi:hypothetical protein